MRTYQAKRFKEDYKIHRGKTFCFQALQQEVHLKNFNRQWTMLNKSEIGSQVDGKSPDSRPERSPFSGLNDQDSLGSKRNFIEPVSALPQIQPSGWSSQSRELGKAQSF